MHNFQIKLRRGARREVPKVEGHKHFGTTPNGSGQHMAILLLIRHGRHKFLMARNHCVRKVTPHSGHAFTDEFTVFTICDEVPLQFHEYVL